MMKKRILAALLATVMLAASATGCAQKGDTGTAAGDRL